MQICIFGAGGVGGLLAVRLAAGGHEVSAVARGAHLNAIRANGLKLVTPAGETVARPHASDRPGDLGSQDLVIVTTKTTALPEVADSIAPLLRPDTPVLFASNGVYWFYRGPGGEAEPAALVPLDPGRGLHNAVGAWRALGIVIYSPNEVVAPGIVRNSGNAQFILGGIGAGSRLRAEPIAQSLAGCGFEISVSDDIRRDMWNKLVRNVASSVLCTLTMADARTTFMDPEIGPTGLAIMKEVLEVASSHGFSSLPIDIDKESRGEGRQPVRPSMLQDLERGRPMEIDGQLRAVRDLARAAGVATPMLELLLPIVIARARAAGCYPAAG